MDQDVINLAKAIRKHESDNNFDAKGKSGESGAYQWTPDTWKAHAEQVLGDPNAQMTPDNQNAVAYGVLKSWKDQGLNPAQIAAKWNSGSESNWENKVSVNKFGLSYNVPKYVKSVTDVYQSIKNGDENAIPNINQQLIPTEQTTTEEPIKKTIGEKINNTATDISNFLGFKGVTDEYGATIAREKAPTEQEKNLVEFPTTKNVVGSAIQGAANFIPGAGEGLGLLGKVGVGAATGYAMDLGANLQSEKSVAESFKPGLGTAVGAGLPIVGSLINKVTKGLPRWLVRTTLKKLPESASEKYMPNSAGGFTKQKERDFVEEALNTKSHTVKGILDESKRAADSIQTQIDSVLGHPQYDGVVGNPKGVFDHIKTELGQSEFVDSNPKIIKIIKNLAKDQSKLVDSVAAGTASLAEQNTLRKALDKIVYPSALDNPNLAFNKRVGKLFTDYIRGNVQTTARELAPLFDEYSKNLTILNAANAASKKLKGTENVSLYDIMAFIHGGAAGVVGERIVRSPRVRLGTAKSLRAIRKSQVLTKARKGIKRIVTQGAANQDSSGQ